MINEINELFVRNTKETFLKPGIYTFLNPFSYLTLRKYKILHEFDGIYIDGISLVKLLNFFGIKVERKSFDMTSLAPEVLTECENKNKSVYFIGAKENEISQFIGEIKREFKGLNIVGFRDGYFASHRERQKIINSILKAKVDVVIVGMGTPLQESFLIDLKQSGFIGVAYTCGGFIHQTSKKIRYYPILFDRLNLRWLYRMIDEPKLTKRYFIYYPKALFFIFTDLLKFKTAKK